MSKECTKFLATAWHLQMMSETDCIRVFREHKRTAQFHKRLVGRIAINFGLLTPEQVDRVLAHQQECILKSLSLPDPIPASDAFINPSPNWVTVILLWYISVFAAAVVSYSYSQSLELSLILGGSAFIERAVKFCSSTLHGRLFRYPLIHGPRLRSITLVTTALSLAVFQIIVAYYGVVAAWKPLSVSLAWGAAASTVALASLAGIRLTKSQWIDFRAWQAMDNLSILRSQASTSGGAKPETCRVVLAQLCDLCRSSVFGTWTAIITRALGITINDYFAWYLEPIDNGTKEPVEFEIVACETTSSDVRIREAMNSIRSSYRPKWDSGQYEAAKKACWSSESGLNVVKFREKLKNQESFSIAGLVFYTKRSFTEHTPADIDYLISLYNQNLLKMPMDNQTRDRLQIRACIAMPVFGNADVCLGVLVLCRHLVGPIDTAETYCVKITTHSLGWYLNNRMKHQTGIDNEVVSIKDVQNA